MLFHLGFMSNSCIIKAHITVSVLDVLIGIKVGYATKDLFDKYADLS